jgi:glutathione S-transferase
MKLYFSNGSCSLSTHIALEESGAVFEAHRLNLREGEQKKPEYLAINPKGKVPALVVDGQTTITEVPAVLSYIADTHPQAKLLAPPGERARAKAQEWMAWCASTVHPHMGPLFRDKENADQRKLVQADLDLYDKWLGGTFVLGETFSAADCYTPVFTLWALHFGLEIGPKMRASAKALLQRPAVQRAVQTHGVKYDKL